MFKNLVIIFVFISILVNISWNVQACNYKGSNNMIYHERGSHYHKTIVNYTCFRGEAEAEQAGYRKSLVSKN